MPSQSVSVSSSGDSTIVAAPGAGKFIRVFSYGLIAGGTVNATWKSGSSARTGPLPLIVNSGSNETDPNGLFDCGVNEALVLGLSSPVQVSGRVRYEVFG